MMNIRKSAKGQDCQVRVPRVCNHNPETVVLAHLGGAGMGRKQHDIHGAYCCSACHDAIDGRRRTPFHRASLKLMHLEGMVRTQRLLLEQGLIEVAQS